MKAIDYHDYRDAIFASGLTSNAKLVALAISYHYNWKTGSWAWPSNKTLAKETSLSVRTVVRAKNELVSTGYLVSRRRFNDSNVYKSVVPCQAGAYLEPDLLLNNEVNNEYNNEKDKDSNESLVSINNIYQEDVEHSFEVLNEGISAAAADEMLSW